MERRDLSGTLAAFHVAPPSVDLLITIVGKGFAQL
jgi:hypothetical protein